MYENKILEYRELIQNEGVSVDALTLLARLEFREEHIKESFDCYKSILLFDANNKEALYFFAVFFYRSDCNDLALKYFNKIVDLGVESPLIYEYIALIKSEESREEYFYKAIHIYKQSKLLQKDFDRLIYIAFKLYKEEYYNLSLEYTLLACSIRNNIDVMNLLGCIHYKIKEYDKALSYFHDINSRLTKINIGLLCNIAYTYKQKGSYKIALMYLKKATDFSLEDERIYYAMGDIYLTDKDEINARLSFKKSLNLNPNFTPASDILESLEE